ncbi:MAG TPA: hypothetical protein VMV46_09100 [Thermoanaerobaculia bacterium]|nr:hypothetical protein [Thermoanaerobaculia bacterium]
MASIPLIILGGSDRRAGPLPSGVRDHRPLSGAKGAHLTVGGRRLIDVLIERFRRASDLFDPVYIAGAASDYRDIASEATIIDTDAGFGRNIRAGVEHARERHPGSPIAMCTCDILPNAAELRELLRDYQSRLPCDFWFPTIAVDDAHLGASEWKPRYRLIPHGGEPTWVLPGHLAIFDPEAMRLRFLYRLLQLGYATRNRSVLQRRAVMLRNLLIGILYQDLVHLLTLRLPNVTWDTVRFGFVAARRLRDGVLTQDQLENAIRHMFVRRRHRRRHPDRPTRLPILRGMSLARDIDTFEEAQALGAVTA